MEEHIISKRLPVQVGNLLPVPDGKHFDTILVLWADSLTAGFMAYPFWGQPVQGMARPSFDRMVEKGIKQKCQWHMDQHVAGYGGKHLEAVTELEQLLLGANEMPVYPIDCFRPLVLTVEPSLPHDPKFAEHIESYGFAFRNGQGSYKLHIQAFDLPLVEKDKRVRITHQRDGTYICRDKQPPLSAGHRQYKTSITNGKTHRASNGLQIEVLPEPV